MSEPKGSKVPSSSPEDHHPSDKPAAGRERRPYESPRIVWREAYEPVSFGVSCAKQPGNPGCNPGPFSA